MSRDELPSISELSFSGHSIMGALSWTEWEVASSNRLEDTERKIKQPEGKPEPLGDGFSSRSVITIPYDSVGRGKVVLENLRRNLFVGASVYSAPPTLTQNIWLRLRSSPYSLLRQM
jgi:hypothetical protein